MKKIRTRVYIAGPYSADNVISVLDNIRVGIQTATELACLGYAPYCPFLDFQMALTGVGSVLDKKDFQEVSMAFVECCHAMLLLPGWESSGGTLRELWVARSLNIPIFTSVGELVEWRVP